MFGLSAEQVDSIKRRLDFLSVEVGDIAKFRDMTQAEYLRDRDRRRSLERLAENVVNATLDIAKILLSAKDLPVPDTYRDIILELGAAGVLDSTLAQRLAETVRLRNILAHQYLDIRWGGLRDFIDKAPDIMNAFSATVERVLPM